MVTFKSWLAEQQHREDSIGALARIPSMQLVEQAKPYRKSDEHKVWTEIVIQISEAGFVDAFNEAWQEFQVAKKKA